MCSRWITRNLGGVRAGGEREVTLDDAVIIVENTVDAVSRMPGQESSFERDAVGGGHPAAGGGYPDRMWRYGAGRLE